MELSFYSLSSGSSGNCYYVGNGLKGILIDAGISATSVRKYLKNKEISMNAIMGVLVTHNHTDHIKGLEVLTRKECIPVFTTAKIRRSVLSADNKISPGSIREIPTGKQFQLAGFDIEAFPVHHDAPETVGYYIGIGDKRLTLATDLGHICDTAGRYLRAANILVLESNYDEQMLDDGSYPSFLKARIRSDHGHLGNLQASSFLAEMPNDGLRAICLAHLSNNNNTPSSVLETLYRAFSERGIAINGNPRILVLNRHQPSEMITI